MENQNPTQPQQPFYPEDEIELMDYLLVLWRWKYLVLTGTIIFGLVAAVVSFSIPKALPIYKVEMVLEPGVKKINEDGKKVYIDSPLSLKSIIEGELKYEILRKIKKAKDSKLEYSWDYQIAIPEGSNLLNISCKSEIAEDGIKKLNFLAEALLSLYKEKVDLIKGEYEETIQSEKKQLVYYQTQLNSEMEIYKRRINNIENRIAEMRIKNNLIKDNTELLIRQRESLINNSTSNDTLSALSYTNIILQNLNLEFSYNKQIFDYILELDTQKMNLLKAQTGIGSILVDKETMIDKETTTGKETTINFYTVQKRNIINEFQEKIEALSKEKNNIQSIQILQPPTATLLSTEKIKVNRNVILASAVGLFLMVFLALFIEYIHKYKGRGN